MGVASEKENSVVVSAEVAMISSNRLTKKDILSSIDHSLTEKSSNFIYFSATQSSNPHHLLREQCQLGTYIYSGDTLGESIGRRLDGWGC